MMQHDLRTQYENDGYYFPLPAIEPTQAEAIAADLTRLETVHGTDVWKRTKMKPHLLIKSINDLMRTPKILDAVEAVLGPDILVWGVGIFMKPAHDPRFFAWHQDSTYWGLSEPAVTTAWVALTPSTEQNGCVRVVPGSHLHEQIPHRETSGTENFLSRGQEIAVDVNEDEAVDMVLEPGEMSLHHVMTVHGSKANTSDIPRIGIGIRYIAVRVAHAPGFEDSATLVRGYDSHGHYLLEPQPQTDFDPKCVEFYDRIVAESKKRADSQAATAR
ncbi:phytanoyl-CoA dioxygenase family protein [Agrobacterium tumefaciens]|uniref:phytanoyl-CoA dioxygenase family protein n=1 Tax=Agrobacterium tumefaciens TaxID=358 RepID=UPI001571BBEB|nr:phytanoyl-CoA dioxygenase family protein [Agrobacterium tumefaciens]NTE65123.1 phytanoyl-CoA dioxygenase family protein [Agrobacterium tumefaciens]